MKVLYYTSPAYLDIALEIINVLKKSVDLHVVIEITPGSKTSNILRLKDFRTAGCIADISELLADDDHKHLTPYFSGCRSANFFIHNSQTGFSSSTIKVFYQLFKFVKELKPDVIHMEEPSLRSLGLFPFAFSSTKICITVHDPVPHSGENSWKMLLPSLLFHRTRYKKSYFFFSEFSKKQFQKRYKMDRQPKYLQKMYPYTIYRNWSKSVSQSKDHILFFGRISKYKGLETLLRAMPKVFAAYPSEHLIIAGRCVEGYQFPKASKEFEVLQPHITYLDRHIPNQELVGLIERAKVVICPYLDATQSGVLMTAYALNTPVIGTAVGAFPEYIQEGVTGLTVPAGDSVALANAIIKILNANLYEIFSQNITSYNDGASWQMNKTILLDAYSA